MADAHAGQVVPDRVLGPRQLGLLPREPRVDPLDEAHRRAAGPPVEEGVGVEAGEGPERKRYAITDAGVTDVEHWLGTPEKPEPYLQNTLYAKVVLALLSGRSADDVLDVQRAAHLVTMRELTKRKARGDLADQLICDHALFHLEADLRWLELAAARLDKLREAVTR